MSAAARPCTNWMLPGAAQQAGTTSTHARAQCSDPPAAPGAAAAAAAAALRGSCQPQPLTTQLSGLKPPLMMAGGAAAVEQRRRRGCSRCITCVPHLRRFEHSLAALAARSRGSSLPLRGSTEDGELWPGGLSSPGLYFAIRARQLQQQCRALSNAAAASLWRPAVEAPVQLLARRGVPQMQVKVPAAFTNVAPGDKCELVAIKDVVLHRPAPQAASTPAAVPTPASPLRATLPCLPGKAVPAPVFPASGSLPVPVTPEDAPLRPRAPSPPMAAAAALSTAATASSAAAAHLAAQLLLQQAQQPFVPAAPAAKPSKRTGSGVQPAEAKRARLSDAFPALSPLLPALQLTPVMDSGTSCGTAPFMFSPRGTAPLHCASFGGSSSSSASSSAASLVGEPSANTVLPLVPLHSHALCSMVPTAAPAAAADQGHYLAVAQQRAASRAFTVVAIEQPPTEPPAAGLASTFLRWLRRFES